MSTIARLTIEQYDRMINSGVFEGPQRERLELIHGEIRKMSPIGSLHEIAVDWLNDWSFQSLPNKAAWVRIQNSVGIPELDSAPEPDVAWVNRRDYSAQRPQPDDVLLIIEVADTSLEYDRGEKAELYAAAGVKDYWIVNVREKCVEVYREPKEGHFRSLQTLTDSDEVSPIAFPEISLKIASLFSADQANENR